MSLVASITDLAGTNSPEFADYTYFGAGTIVDTTHPGVAGGLDLTMGNSQNGYNGLDQWGRVVDQLWQSGGVTVDEYKYGCDADGDVLWKQNAGPGATDLDELYSYDGLNRLTAMQRGTLSGQTETPPHPSIADKVFAQDWTLDPLGNMVGSSTNGTMQDRTASAANEISSINGNGSATGYDLAGNLTSDGTFDYTYDAWDRQVGVATAASTPVPIAKYEFDGLNRRIQETVYNPGLTTVNATTDFYYNEDGQILQAQEAPTGKAAVTTQYVWDISYIDTPIAQIQTSGTYYYMTDANHNVTGLVSASTGAVVERYVYSPYGQVTFCNVNWAPLTAPPAGSSNNNGVGPQNSTTLQGVASNYGNQILYCGYYFDPETAVTVSGVAGVNGNSQDRAREYSAVLGNFTSRDPMGYAAADDNLYRYCGNAPTDGTDPSGLAGQLDTVTTKLLDLLRSDADFLTFLKEQGDRVFQNFDKIFPKRDFEQNLARAVYDAAYSAVFPGSGKSYYDTPVPFGLPFGALQVRAPHLGVVYVKFNGTAELKKGGADWCWLLAHGSGGVTYGKGLSIKGTLGELSNPVQVQPAKADPSSLPKVPANSENMFSALIQLAVNAEAQVKQVGDLAIVGASTRCVGRRSRRRDQFSSLVPASPALSMTSSRNSRRPQRRPTTSLAARWMASLGHLETQPSPISSSSRTCLTLTFPWETGLVAPVRTSTTPSIRRK